MRVSQVSTLCCSMPSLVIDALSFGFFLRVVSALGGWQFGATLLRDVQKSRYQLRWRRQGDVVVCWATILLLCFGLIHHALWGIILPSHLLLGVCRCGASGRSRSFFIRCWRLTLLHIHQTSYHPGPFLPLSLLSLFVHSRPQWQEEHKHILFLNTKLSIEFLYVNLKKCVGQQIQLYFVSHFYPETGICFLLGLKTLSNGLYIIPFLFLRKECTIICYYNSPFFSP